jgi:hypothetical protein
MEADWEVEIGSDAAVIDACWAGFVDLRNEPALARQLPETTTLPGLADALVRLNAASPQTGLWTAKCDAWPITDQDAIDPYELDASPAEAAYAWACYIDLLPDSGQRGRGWTQTQDRETDPPMAAISWCKTVSQRLHADPLGSCRVDLMIRRAFLEPEIVDIGITAYLIACGATSDAARQRLSTLLERATAQFVRGVDGVNGFDPAAKVE